MAPKRDLPLEIWGQIISNLVDDHHDEFSYFRYDYDHNLATLSLVSKSFLSITNQLKQTLTIINLPTNSSIPSYSPLFHRFPNLKHISFSKSIEDPLPILLQIADFDIRLETLDIPNWDYLSIKDLDPSPFSKLTGLKTLKMPYCKSIDDGDLEWIANLFPNLEDLDLSYPINYNVYEIMYCTPDYILRCRRSTRVDTSTTRENSLSKLKSLKRINFKWSEVSNEVFVWIAKNCPNLERIVVKERMKVTIEGVKSALKACKNLKCIRISNSNS